MKEKNSSIERVRKQEDIFSLTANENFDEFIDFDDEIRIANHHALGNLRMIGSRNDQKNISMNLGKVADKTTSLLQQKYLHSFDYYQIRKNAEKEFEESNFFEKYKIINLEKIDGTSRNSKTENEIKANIKEIAIKEKIKEHIVKYLNDGEKNKIKISVELFFRKMGIASVYKDGKLSLGRAIDTIKEIQSRSTIESKEERLTIDEENKTVDIEKVLTVTYQIPKISFVVDKNCEFDSVEELRASRKHNKEKYIKYMEIKFDTETYADKVAPVMDYVTSYLSIRDQYSTTYSRIFDSWMRSLYGIQKYTHVNRYTLKDLNRKWDINYNRYSDIKNKVLTHVIEDFNKNDDIQVKMKEVYDGHIFLYVYFIITKTGIEEKDESLNYRKLAYYITMQHILSGQYNNKEKPDFNELLEEIRGFVENKEKNENNRYCTECENDKTLAEWEKEHHKAIEAFEKLQVAESKDKKMFEKRNIKVCIKKLCLVDKDSGDVYKTFGGMEVNNPILSFEFYKEFKGENNQ